MFKNVRLRIFPAACIGLPASLIKLIPEELAHQMSSSSQCQLSAPGSKMSCMALKSPPIRQQGEGMRLII